MSVTFDFSGRVALITGSSSGIGAATAVLFAKSGAQVVVTGRNSDKVLEVAQQCQQVSPNNSKPLQVVADMTKEDDQKKLVNETMAAFGRLDVLVNNAGFAFVGPIIDDNYMQAYRNTLDINLTSVLRLTQLCFPHLEKTDGNIVNISSVSAYMASELSSPYCMSKSALDMFTKCMAVELGPKGIRVNSVNPGAVKTFIMERAGLPKIGSDTIFEMYGSKYPIGRPGESEDIANSILFLASDASAFTTGTIMVVDGGHMAANVKLDPKEMPLQ